MPFLLEALGDIAKERQQQTRDQKPFAPRQIYRRAPSKAPAPILKLAPPQTGRYRPASTATSRTDRTIKGTDAKMIRRWRNRLYAGALSTAVPQTLRCRCLAAMAVTPGAEPRHSARYKQRNPV